MSTTHAERLAVQDTFIEAICKLSDGNPGAINVLGLTTRDAGTIDTQCSPLMYLLSLDSFGIYGSRIWILFKDVCGEQLALFLACLRAAQLGLISRAQLNQAVDAGRWQTSIEPAALITLVRERLGSFDDAAIVKSEAR